MMTESLFSQIQELNYSLAIWFEIMRASDPKCGFTNKSKIQKRHREIRMPSRNPTFHREIRALGCSGAGSGWQLWAAPSSEPPFGQSGLHTWAQAGGLMEFAT